MRTIGRASQIEIDQAAVDELGLPVLLLMEHAALALVTEIREIIRKRDVKRVMFLCGEGNNGGDAYAAARLLLEDLEDSVEVAVFESKDRKVGAGNREASLNRAMLERLGIEIQGYDEVQINADDLLVDAVFGTAFRLDRALNTEVRSLFQQIHEARIAFASVKNRAFTVLAVDIPSGVEADTGRTHDWAIQADYTVTFIAPKTGIINYPGRKYAGQWRTASLALPTRWIEAVFARQAWRDPRLIDGGEIRARAHATARAADSHKGSNRHIALLAGSPGMCGAAILATRASIVAGSGLVTSFVPESIAGNVLNAVPSALVQPMPREVEARLSTWQQIVEVKDAIGIGPGLGQLEGADEGVEALLFAAIRSAKRLVLDADALNIISRDSLNEEAIKLLRERVERGLEAAVLTPHPGEAKRLLAAYTASDSVSASAADADLAIEDRLEAARVLAERYHAIIVLKGAGTVVHIPTSAFSAIDSKSAMSEAHVWINSSGNAGMAKGGSGDLLTGMISSFLGQGLAVETAVIAAVYLHGRAADLAVASGSERSLMPEDVLPKLAMAYKEVNWA